MSILRYQVLAEQWCAPRRGFVIMREQNHGRRDRRERFERPVAGTPAGPAVPFRLLSVDSLHDTLLTSYLPLQVTDPRRLVRRHRIGPNQRDKWHYIRKSGRFSCKTEEALVNKTTCHYQPLARAYSSG